MLLQSGTLRVSWEGDARDFGTSERGSTSVLHVGSKSNEQEPMRPYKLKTIMTEMYVKRAYVVRQGVSAHVTCSFRLMIALNPYA